MFHGTDHCECFEQGSIDQKELVLDVVDVKLIYFQQPLQNNSVLISSSRSLLGSLVRVALGHAPEVPTSPHRGVRVALATPSVLRHGPLRVLQARFHRPEGARVGVVRRAVVVPECSRAHYRTPIGWRAANDMPRRGDTRARNRA